MKLTEIETNISNLKMDKDQKEAILKLIDLKTDSDMDKFISEMKRLEDRIDTRTTMILWAIGILIGLIVTLKVIR